jgi:anti-sigma factor ChrR (cupin superfamily)
MQTLHSPWLGQSGPKPNRCDQSELTCCYALQVLPPSEVAAVEAHIASCPDGRRERQSLRPVIDSFVAWPSDVLRPTTSLQARLSLRIAEETGKQPLPPARYGEQAWSEPAWEQVAPGIECKLLATDAQRQRVSMLVRLAPGASYPAHTHAGVEELHLLDGELWIDERRLFPGDYNYGAPGAGDERIWSETGCTCLLVTSTDDVLR